MKGKRQINRTLTCWMVSGRGFPVMKQSLWFRERVLQKPVMEMYNQLSDEDKRLICLFPTRKACADVKNEIF